MDTIVQWLSGYFSESHDLGDDPLDRDIFEAGWIDSFGTIVLVEAIEDEFALRFTEDSFLDRRFSSIRGIAEIVFEVKDA